MHCLLTLVIPLLHRSLLLPSILCQVGDDVVLWQRFAELASEEGQYGLARIALESGLRVSPSHLLLLEKLLVVSRRHGGRE